MSFAAGLGDSVEETRRRHNAANGLVETIPDARTRDHLARHLVQLAREADLAMCPWSGERTLDLLKVQVALRSVRDQLDKIHEAWS